jgi:hypothetical protein
MLAVDKPAKTAAIKIHITGYLRHALIVALAYGYFTQVLSMPQFG